MPAQRDVADFPDPSTYTRFLDDAAVSVATSTRPEPRNEPEQNA